MRKEVQKAEESNRTCFSTSMRSGLGTRSLYMSWSSGRRFQFLQGWVEGALCWVNQLLKAAALHTAAHARCKQQAV